jgi:hypothetical protein
METLITVCHRRKEPRMTQPTKGPDLAELAKKKRGVRQRAKRNRVLAELRDAESFLRDLNAGNGSREISFSKVMSLYCTINSAIRLITQLRMDDGS